MVAAEYRRTNKECRGTKDAAQEAPFGLRHCLFDVRHSLSVLLPAGAAAARLIVCERSGRWAVALRRELAAGEVRVYETRSLADCWAMLAQSPASFLILEFTAGSGAALLPRIARLGRDFPLARVAVVADRSLADSEWLMREAGAVHFVCSPRQSGPLACLARRHLAQAPPPPRSLTEQIWAGLPWGKQAQPAAAAAADLYYPRRFV
jgi:hypothetical protein